MSYLFYIAVGAFAVYYLIFRNNKRKNYPPGKYYSNFIKTKHGQNLSIFTFLIALNRSMASSNLGQFSVNWGGNTFGFPAL